MAELSFHEKIAQKLIEQMKQGIAPWQRPWLPGDINAMVPMNPVTDKRYKGINAIQLMSEKYSDPRWMTYKQATTLEGQVRKGEKGTRIQYWTFTEEKSKTDENGQIILDEQGKPTKVTCRLERPKVFFATVFNAEQIDGLPPLQKKVLSWSPIERAEKILQASGAVINHKEGDKAFYQIATDSIHMPNKHQFACAENYYATILHELGHWTGHSSRLDRDLVHPFGSEGYAKEELRAEIASMILGCELGVGHDPSQHAAYVASWIQVLKNDPLEIFRAAADAEKIQNFVLSLEQVQEVEITQINEQPLSVEVKPVASQSHSANEQIKLAISYEEHKAAKQLAGMLPDGRCAIVWDKARKSWFARPGADLDRLKPWLLNANNPRQADALSPQQEFADQLKHIGATVTGDHPIMDGQKHRIHVDGDKKGEQSGFYVGHLDGHPAGYIKNNRTGIELKWKSKGFTISDEQKSILLSQASEKRKLRDIAHTQRQEQAANRVSEQLLDLTPITVPTPYLKTKGIESQTGIFTDNQAQTTYIPAIDETGKIWTMQSIYADGTKRFAKDGRKEGCFHAIGGLDAIAKAPIIVIAEGYATAASVSKAIEMPIIVAFDAGNLEPVARALHKKFPDKPIIITGDDDKHLEITQGINPGKTKAMNAAFAVNGTAVFPIFPPNEQKDHPKKFTDFNDLATNSLLGLSGVKRQIKQVIDRSRIVTSYADDAIPLKRVDARRL